VHSAGSERASRRRELDPELGSPGEARAVLRSACLAWGVDDEVRDDAELIVSELVANVVDHAGTRCTLGVTATDDGLLIEVRDFYPCSPPQARPVDPAARRGRGLQVVAALSSRWGVIPYPDGKSIWALLPRASPTTVLHVR
jgi:anti-sigma regulatory factor (Ser/Thr protein kinase)